MEISFGWVDSFVFFTKENQTKLKGECGFKGEHIFGVSMFIGGMLRVNLYDEYELWDPHLLMKHI